MFLTGKLILNVYIILLSVIYQIYIFVFLFVCINSEFSAKRGQALQQKNQIKMQIDELQQQKKKRLRNVITQNSGKNAEQIQNLEEQNGNQFDAEIRRLELAYIQKQQETNKEIQQTLKNQLHQFCILLIKLMKMQRALTNYKTEQQQLKDIMLAQLRQIEQLKIIKDLAAALRQIENCDQIIHSIKTSCKYFEFQAQTNFYQSTKGQTIEYTVTKLKTKYVHQSQDEDTYAQRKSQEEMQIKKEYEYVISVFNELKRTGKQIKEIKQSISKTNPLQQIASILAVWSTMKRITGAGNEILSQPIPHPVQIVTLILLIKNHKQSKLAQVKTGQGKSIILATLAIYYARMDYKVKVVCYSKYLSQRDHAEFLDLFEEFGVTDKIYYGTFVQSCQLFLQNGKQNLKDTAKRFLIGSNNDQKTFLQKTTEALAITKNAMKEVYNTVNNTVTNFFGRKKEEKQITLIDQVDVLFENEYLGQVFRPVVKLAEPLFKELIKYVYELGTKNKVVKAKDVFESKIYKTCIQTYPKLSGILEMQIYGMLQEFINKSPKNTYQVHQQKIKYRDKDKLSEKLHYGYETIFANCKEYAAGRIAQSNYQQNLFIPIKIGELSYSQLPGQSVIQGLSGTVDSLSGGKYQILDDKFNIPAKKIYILPSIYGENSKILPVCHLANNKNFYQLITKKMVSEVQKNRPVVVCFENYRQLKNFENSKQFKQLNIKCSYLHELQNNQMRNKAVKGAGSKRTITLMTSQFSRGTDFLVIDRTVKKSGGLALIMAYIPKSQSQFQQFKGRTGRQGSNGSIDIFFNIDEFSEILKQSNFQNAIELPSSSDQILQVFYGFWEELDKMQTKEKKIQLKVSKQKHQRFKEIIKQMEKPDKGQQFLKYVKQLNQYTIPPVKHFTILFGIDGTGSMGIIFQKLIATLTNIVSRINEIKEQLNVSSQFDLKIAVYRNYNTGPMILEVTREQKSPEELIGFLNQVEVQGGMGNEAIEVLYRYINTSQTQFDMLILIGDAPPNTAAEIKQNRKFINDKPNTPWIQYQKSPQYNKQFFKIRSSEEELARFKKDFIIHGLAIKTAEPGTQNYQYQLNSKFKNYVKNLSAKFSGESRQLDLNIRRSEQELIQFITTKISCLINGQRKELIEEIYNKKYKSYV